MWSAPIDPTSPSWPPSPLRRSARKPDRLARLILRETAHLDGRLHLADRGADVRIPCACPRCWPPVRPRNRLPRSAGFRSCRRALRTETGWRRGRYRCPTADATSVSSEPMNSGLELAAEPDPHAIGRPRPGRRRDCGDEGGGAGQQKSFHERRNLPGHSLVADAYHVVGRHIDPAAPGLRPSPLDQLLDDHVGRLLG